MKRPRKTWILKLDPRKNTEKEELEFELDFQASLTPRQRLEMLHQRSRDLLRMMYRRQGIGHTRTTEITQRS